MKIINDTLKSPSGKWSRKSLTAFMAFAFALLYVIIPLIPAFRDFEPQEYVFITLISFSATALGLTVVGKVFASKYNTTE